MNDYAIYDGISVPLSRDLPPESRPTLSLSLTCRGLPSPETIASLSPHVDEIVVVALDASAADLRPATAKPTTTICVSPRSHPELYLPDVPETFEKHRSLAGEEYRGPFSGVPFVADRSAARNLGLGACTQEWRLVLDDGEVLADPDRAVGACSLLDQHHRDVCFASRASADHLEVIHTARLARNIKSLRWEGTSRETLEGGIRPAIIAGCLHSTWTPEAPEVVCRALYAEARQRDWDIAPTNLLHLTRAAWSCRALGGLTFAFCAKAIDTYLESSLYPEERAWACAIQGQILEDQEDLATACRWYERSLEEHACWKTWYRLSRLHFLQKQWRDCVDAYNRGLELQDQVPLVDDGPETCSRTLICVAHALDELGQHAQARAACQSLLELFPTSPKVAALCSRMT